MPNLVINNIDLGSVIIGDAFFRDELLTFAATHTCVEGTLLARRRENLVPTASAITGTGNGTLTALSIVASPAPPAVGAYTLTCIATVANGGRWSLKDPSGAIIADDLEMTVGAGVATAFDVGGLQFTLTDGSTDFAAGATFTITVASDGKLVPYDPAGAGGVQIPMGVLTYDVSRTGAGDVAIRAMVSGQVNKNRLIIDVDGTGANITAEILDQLRIRGIMAIDVKQIAALDNQP